MGEKADILYMKEYRGCGIRALSYKTSANEWVPEACFWLPTHYGLQRLWIASFAHCFGRSDLTFAKKIDADNWAFRRARELIDRTLPDFANSPAQAPITQKSYMNKIIQMVRRPFTAIHIVKDSQYRN